MEVESQTSSTETQTASPVETSQASTPAATTAAPEATATQTAETSLAPEGTPAAGVPAWTPDFKFKAAGAEHEIPEMYRGLIKDQKTLEEVKRLHEKAYGVDSLVQSRDSLKNQISSLAPKIQEYETVSRNFAKLSHFVENKDFDSFFQGLGIPEKDIVGWIQHKIDLANATPEVKQAYEQNRQLMAQQWDQQQQLQTYQEQAMELQRAQAYNEVFSTVNSVAGDFAQAYDSKMGEGAFIEAVINRGIQITNATGQEPQLEAVIAMMTGELQKLGVTPQAPAPAQSAPQGSPAPKPKQTMPVIPAGGQSPVSTPVKSMDDLKKRAAAFGL